MNVLKTLLVWVLCCFLINISTAQEAYNLKSCVQYALENNHKLKNSQLDREKAWKPDVKSWGVCFRKLVVQET